MNNPLTNVLTPKIRAWLYAALFVASTLYGIWQGSNGDWQKAVAAAFPALLGLVAASNASPTPPKGRHEQAGSVDVLMLLAVLNLVAVTLLLFRVHF